MASHHESTLIRLLREKLQDPHLGKLELNCLFSHLGRPSLRHDNVGASRPPTEEAIQAKLSSIRILHAVYTRPANIRGQRHRQFTFWHLALLWYLPEGEMARLMCDSDGLNALFDDCVAFFKQFLTEDFEFRPFRDFGGDTSREPRVGHGHYVLKRDRYECFLTTTRDALQITHLWPFAASFASETSTAQHRRLWHVAERLLRPDLAATLDTLFHTTPPPPPTQDHDGLWNGLTLTATLRHLFESGYLGLEPLPDNAASDAGWGGPPGILVEAARPRAVVSSPRHRRHPGAVQRRRDAGRHARRDPVHVLRRWRGRRRRGRASCGARRRGTSSRATFSWWSAPDSEAKQNMRAVMQARWVLTCVRAAAGPAGVQTQDWMETAWHPDQDCDGIPWRGGEVRLDRARWGIDCVRLGR